MMVPARIIRAFTEALFPTRCLVCGSFFHSGPPECFDNASNPTNGFQIDDLPSGESSCGDPLGLKDQKQVLLDCFTASLVCPTCRVRFLPVASPMCIQCGAVFKSKEGDDRLCGACIESPKRFRIARAYGVYDETLMALVHCLKYDGKLQLARPLGSLLLSTYFQFWNIGDIDLILPVPLHIKRFRERGFNQSHLLVKDWAQMNFQIPTVERDVLVRKRKTVPQTGLGRKRRINNIKDAFSVSDPLKITGKKVLLVDDVFTTGATVDECTKVLHRAGAKQVDVLTLARAL